jgi:hypothetical protein
MKSQRLFRHASHFLNCATAVIQPGKVGKVDAEIAARITSMPMSLRGAQRRSKLDHIAALASS